METIEVRMEAPVAELRMNRPEVLNAANRQWMEDLGRALDELENAAGLRVVLVSGAGRSFSTGIDLKALATGEIQLGWFRDWERNLRRLENLEPITVAKMQGYSIGGGLQIGLACDLRIAAEDCQVGLPAVLEALIPGLGTWRLPRYVGLGRAKRMILTGELIQAAEALRIGLVDWVFPNAELDSGAQRIVRQLMTGSVTAQTLAKRLATAAFETDWDAISGAYLDYQSRTIASPEHKAAMEAYRKHKRL